jgi:anti-sigma B factor antagonist
MNQAATSMSVCVKSPCAWVKIQGRADFRHSEALKTLVHGLLRQGCSKILLEFTHCVVMDSTFAGTMSSLARELDKGRADNRTPMLYVLNANQRVTDTLTILGVMPLLQQIKQTTPNAREFEVVESDVEKQAPKDLARLMWEAHRELIEINPANAGKFQDVLKFLEEDLKRLEGEGSAKAKDET